MKERTLQKIFELVKSNGIISAVILAVVTAGVLSSFAISEPKLVHVSRPIEPPVLALKQDNENIIFHIKLWAEFKNNGLKRGHVADVQIIPDGLNYFPNVKLTYLDKGQISWLRKKRVLCEFLVTTNPEEVKNAFAKAVAYRVVYYGSSGNELYVQGVRFYPSKNGIRLDPDLYREGANKTINPTGR